MDVAEHIVAIIPARMASTRFPGKPLAPILGIPMVGHVFARTKMCRLVSEAYVATCDRDIRDYVASIGGKALMTSDKHQRCSDRCAEALLAIEKDTGRRVDIVAMVQGDEPMVLPEMIDAAVALLRDDPEAGVSCLMAPIDPAREGPDPNNVKVVVDLKGHALYFSREPIPSTKKATGPVSMFKQVAVIPFRRDALLRFTALPPTPLEVAESVDLMRLVEHGDKVRMGETRLRSVAVDTPADLEKASEAMRGDPLVLRYAEGLAR